MFFSIVVQTQLTGTNNMKRNTATQLLRLLSDEEIRRFSKFLRSPYFNYSQPVIALFDYLRRHHPDYDAKRIRPPVFWKKIYSGKQFSEQKYWTLNFKLRTLIERFLAIEEMEGNESEFKKQLIKSHGQRNAHALFEKETISLVEKLQSQPGQDTRSYAESLWLKHDYFFHSLTNKYGKAVYSVEQVMEELDRFYVLAKLHFAGELKNRERMFSQKSDIRLLEESVALSKQFKQENPAFILYHSIINLHEPEKAVDAFRSGLKALEEQSGALSRVVQSVVLLNLTNYAIRQWNKGIDTFRKDLFRLYKLALKLGFVIVNEKIKSSTFINIVHVGCLEREFDWTSDFIETHQQYLEEENREKIARMGYAELYLVQKKFDKALDFAGGLEFENVLLNCNTKVITSKIWFEKFLNDNGFFDLVISRLAADEKYFRRNTAITEQRKSAHINFILALKQLCGLIYQKRPKDEILQKMEGYVKGSNMVAKKWLHDKLMQPK